MKNKQQIETFIRTHNSALNQDSPSDALWLNIDRILTRLKKSDPLEQFVAINRPLLDQEVPNTSLWDNIRRDLNRTEDIPECDLLEQFILQNRAELDTDTPNLNVWGNVSGVVEQQPTALRVIWRKRLVRAAAAIALLVIGAAMGLWYANYQNNAYSGMKMSEVSDEYAALEAQYERDIASKKEQLAKFTSNQGAEDILTDLDQMDKVMEELRIELSNVPPGNREQIIRIMIENYKTKAMVLEKVLNAIQAQQNGTLPSTQPLPVKKSGNETI